MLQFREHQAVKHEIEASIDKPPDVPSKASCVHADTLLSKVRAHAGYPSSAMLLTWLSAI